MPQPPISGMDSAVFEVIMDLALFEPDIPQNAGTLMRLGACLNVRVHLIEPAGFPTSDRHFRRAGMDYLDRVEIVRHVSWRTFHAWQKEAGQRLVLATTKAAMPYFDFAWHPDDIILLGRESKGVPDTVQEAADARVLIPLMPGLRSLNVALAGGMILGEALRQTRGFPPEPGTPA